MPHAWFSESYHFSFFSIIMKFRECLLYDRLSPKSKLFQRERKTRDWLLDGETWLDGVSTMEDISNFALHLSLFFFFFSAFCVSAMIFSFLFPSIYQLSVTYCPYPSSLNQSVFLHPFSLPCSFFISLFLPFSSQPSSLTSFVQGHPPELSDSVKLLLTDAK